MKKMSGQQYEEHCARLLEKKGYSEVERTGGSGDMGVDILATLRGKRYGIQCKYYAKPVGSKAVQEVCAGIRYYGCDTGVVLTNSTFTPAAEELAQSTDIELWDRGQIRHARASENLFVRLLGLLCILLAAAGLLSPFLPGAAALSPLQTFRWACLLLTGLLCLLARRRLRRTLSALAGSFLFLLLTLAVRPDSPLFFFYLAGTLLLLFFSVVRGLRRIF